MKVWRLAVRSTYIYVVSRLRVDPVLPIARQKFPRYCKERLASFSRYVRIFGSLFHKFSRNPGWETPDHRHSEYSWQKFKWSLTDFFEVGFIEDIHAFLTLALALNSGTGNDNVCAWRPYDWPQLLRTFFSTSKDVLHDDVTHDD
jgi:hypothetical protein